jgi:hypothetical protein
LSRPPGRLLLVTVEDQAVADITVLGAQSLAIWLLEPRMLRLLGDAPSTWHFEARARDQIRSTSLNNSESFRERAEAMRSMLIRLMFRVPRSMSER